MELDRSISDLQDLAVMEEIYDTAYLLHDFTLFVLLLDERHALESLFALADTIVVAHPRDGWHGVCVGVKLICKFFTPTFTNLGLYVLVRCRAAFVGRLQYFFYALHRFIARQRHASTVRAIDGRWL